MSCFFALNFLYLPFSCLLPSCSLVFHLLIGHFVFKPLFFLYFMSESQCFSSWYPFVCVLQLLFLMCPVSFSFVLTFVNFFLGSLQPGFVIIIYCLLDSIFVSEARLLFLNLLLLCLQSFAKCSIFIKYRI